ncbi:hypothetical protein PT7_0247 [Pusillimonas sp. T7-7]|uniref:hypothetical protein n=1 Tax=Pusillimonas sp. (strain T7-7) TaxID=1007105 RepID=UPI00020849AE|nr:hypothetical protein [Pusillimonas sp. T7-7]AEC18787.1 hypothetical protein PT7_0247 [Pusillimonas sp. T7-7]
MNDLDSDPIKLEAKSQLTDFLDGYIKHHPCGMDLLLLYLDWSDAAALLLKLRAIELLDRLPVTALHAIASGHICPTDTACGLTR